MTMKKFNDLTECHKLGILEWFKKQGFNSCVYHPEGEKGMSKNGVGFMLKDLVIED